MTGILTHGQMSMFLEYFLILQALAFPVDPVAPGRQPPITCFGDNWVHLPETLAFQSDSYLLPPPNTPPEWYSFVFLVYGPGLRSACLQPWSQKPCSVFSLDGGLSHGILAASGLGLRRGRDLLHALRLRREEERWRHGLGFFSKTGSVFPGFLMVS